MKLVLSILAFNIPAIACVVFAGLLAIDGKDGWGWFLVFAVLCVGSIKVGRGKG